MKVNLPVLTLCLLGIALSGVTSQGTSPDEEATAPPVTTPDSAGSASTADPGPVTTPDSTGSASTADPGTVTTPDSTGTTNPTGTVTTSGTETATTAPPVEDEPQFSPGEIAGITIGSIAGVAALGGGVFGALKYTGRI